MIWYIASFSTQNRMPHPVFQSVAVTSQLLKHNRPKHWSVRAQKNASGELREQRRRGRWDNISKEKCEVCFWTMLQYRLYIYRMTLASWVLSVARLSSLDCSTLMQWLCQCNIDGICSQHRLVWQAPLNCMYHKNETNFRIEIIGCNV